MKNIIVLAIMLLNAVLCVGCKTVAYDPAYTRPVAINIVPRYQGKLLLFTTPSDDKLVFHGHPKSVTGVLWNLKVPLGEMSKKIAGDSYGHLFGAGYEFGNEFNTNNNRFSVILHPQIEDFAWRMNQAKNLGFAITPQVQMTLNLQLLSADKNTVIFQRQYESGWIDGNSYLISITPFDSVSAAIHKTIANLMVDSIRDLDAVLRPDASQTQPLPRSFGMKDEGMENVQKFWAAWSARMEKIENSKPQHTQPLVYSPLISTQLYWLEGATIIAADGQFLGQVTKNTVASDSIGNEVGKYGSSVATTSIFNTVGQYGSSVSSLSPWNTVAPTPPRLITTTGRWAFLTTNQALNPRVDPSLVVAYLKSN